MEIAGCEEVVLRSGGGGNHCIPAQNARDPEAELSRVAIGNGRIEFLRPHIGIRHQTEKVSPGRTSVLHNLQSSSTTCDPSPLALHFTSSIDRFFSENIHNVWPFFDRIHRQAPMA